MMSITSGSTITLNDEISSPSSPHRHVEIRRVDDNGSELTLNYTPLATPIQARVARGELEAQTICSPSSATLIENPGFNGNHQGHQSVLAKVNTTPNKELLILPVPTWLRLPGDAEGGYPERVELGTGKIVVLGVVAAVFMANIFYCQPLLVQIAQSFQVSYEDVSRLPTLIQAGYAAGLFFICPLGDLFRKRQLILVLMTCTATLTVVMAIVNDLLVMEVVGFLIGFSNMTPQLLIPFVAGLVPKERRGFASSLVIVGTLSGPVFGRVMAGAVSDTAVGYLDWVVDWKLVYYVAFAAQYGMLGVCYFGLPDCPLVPPVPVKGTSAGDEKLGYADILISMLRSAVTEPVLAQALIVGLASNMCSGSYWGTIAFFLEGAPYHLTQLAVGLFGLTGLIGIALGPLTGRMVDRISPRWGVLVATILLMVFQAIQTAAGQKSIAAVAVASIGLDASRQMQTVSLVATIFRGVSTGTMTRLNAVFALACYIGQLVGTTVGTKLFVRYGKLVAGILSLSLYACQILVMALFLALGGTKSPSV